jgi:hypothetical protein
MFLNSFTHKNSIYKIDIKLYLCYISKDHHDKKEDNTI